MEDLCCWQSALELSSHLSEKHSYFLKPNNLENFTHPSRPSQSATLPPCFLRVWSIVLKHRVHTESTGKNTKQILMHKLQD